MRIKTLVSAIGAVVLAGVAQAQGRIHGNWEGSITKGDLKGTSLSAKVVGESEHEYLVLLTVGEGVEVQFRGLTQHGMTTFFGSVDLGEARGGAHAVNALAANDAMEGVLRKGLGKPNEFAMKRVEKGSPTLGMSPPNGAIVLMDGANLDQWTPDPPTWRIIGNEAAEVTSSNLRTLDEYGSGTYHIEFKTPYMPGARGQARGNSGVYLLGRYEMQVLDSWPNPPADNEAGGIYKQAVPLVNASLPPLEWQTYDIEFTAPAFDASGTKTQNARLTVRHNGVLIHDDLELTDVTPGGVSGTEAPTGPLMFQHHGDRVQYRNVWHLAK